MKRVPAGCSTAAVNRLGSARWTVAIRPATAASPPACRRACELLARVVELAEAGRAAGRSYLGGVARSAFPAGLIRIADQARECGLIADREQAATVGSGVALAARNSAHTAVCRCVALDGVL